MNDFLNIYYQDLPVKQVSIDEQTGIGIGGYNNYQQPFFNLNDNKDGCTIETSKNGIGLICFVKIQNEGDPIYYRGLASVNYLDNNIIFECHQVFKDNITNKGIRKENEKIMNFN